MKKIAKLSLVAAMAVTAANAGSLEEAIKNVDVSGKVYVEHIANSNKLATGGAEETASLTDIDVDITFKSKVNDNVTAVVRVQADQEDSETAAAGGQDVTVDNVYFTYQNGPLTVNTGKQDINTPNTDGEVGNGVLALYNAGFATFAAAHFVSNEVATLNGDVTAAAILASLGPVNAEAWYVGLSENSLVGSSDHYTLVASTKLAGVTLGARHAITKFDATSKKDASTTKVTASAAFGPVGVNATYLTTDKDGAATVTDASSANTYELSQFGSFSQNADADVWAIGASYTADAMKYQVDYAAGEEDVNNTEADELRFRATYTMSKNFKVMATYSMYEVENAAGAKTTENDSARLEAKYSF